MPKKLATEQRSLKNVSFKKIRKHVIENLFVLLYSLKQSHLLKDKRHSN